MTISRMEERKSIAFTLDAAQSERRSINEREDLKLARLRAAEADAAAREANAAVSAMFRNVRDEFELAESMAESHEGLHLSGGEYDTPWVTRCAVTKLPLFEGDRVYVVNVDEDGDIRAYILAEALTLAPGVDAEPIVLGSE